MKTSSIQIQTGGQKEETGLPKVRKKVWFGVVLLLSFWATGAKVLSSLSPFGLAVMAALPVEYSFFAFLGSLAGCLIFGGISQNFAAMIGLLVMLGLKILLASFSRLRKNLGLLSVLAGAVSLGAGMITAYVMELSAAGTALKVAEALLTGGFTCFTGITYRFLASGRPLSAATVQELSSGAAVGSMLILALFSLSIGYVNLGRVAGIGTCLILAYGFGLTGGAAGGVIAALCAVLYDSKMAPGAGMLAIAGFFAGMFRPLGKLPLAAAFIVTNAAGALMIGGGEQALLQMVDVFAATVLFMALPERLLGRVKDALPQYSSKKREQTGDMSKTIASKLEFASKTLEDLKDSVSSVSEKMDRISAADISTVYHKTADQVCRRCGLNMFCWETAYNDTMNAFHSMTKILRERGKIVPSQAPPHFQNKCCKLTELTDTVSHNYQTFLAREKAMRRVSDSRSVAIEQFNGVADMLCEISSELSGVTRYDHKAAHKVREVLRERGLKPMEICCLIDKFGRMGMEVYFNGPLKTDLGGVADQISDALARDFDFPSVITVDGRTKLAFFERANYTVDFAAAQSPHRENQICGDAYEYFMDSKGFVHLILSDGMGTGGRAAIDSVMTCSLILKLIKAGFGFQSALKLVNASLLVKSDDESLATLDIARLDLYTGKAEFFKAGSAASFVLRGGKVLQIETSSLPIGILQNIEFDISTLTIEAGDIVVMVSDGVLLTGSGWMEAEIEAGRQKPAKELANRLLEEARRRSDPEHSDDLTVLVAKVKKGI